MTLARQRSAGEGGSNAKAERETERTERRRRASHTRGGDARGSGLGGLRGLPRGLKGAASVAPRRA